MKTYYYYLMACCCAATLLACAKNEPATPTPEMTVTPMELVFAASDNQPQIVQVDTNVEWTYRTEDTASQWLTVEEVAEGLQVAVADNISEEARATTLKIMPLSAGLSIQTVTISQLATDFSAYEITVAPEDQQLNFAAAGNAPRTINVSVTGNLAWTATPDVTCEGWLTVTQKTNALEIAVIDNEWMTARDGVITLTTVQDFGIAPVKIQVHQEMLPMFQVGATEVMLQPGGGMDSQATIIVLTNMGDWDAVISSTADGTGAPVDWLTITTLNKEDGSVMIEATENATGVQRTAYVIISSLAGDVEPIAVTVTQQSLNLEGDSTLTGPVQITDMESGAQNYVYFTPTYPTENFFGPYESAIWEIDLWASTVEQYVDGYYTSYRGTGTRLRIYLRSDKMMHSEDGVYVLAPGSYPVDLDYANKNGGDTPHIIVPGDASMGGDDAMRYPVGSWYMELDGTNTYVETAPLTGGELIVEYDEATGEYRLTCNFTDDRGNAITGTVVTKLDNMLENYTEIF